MGRRQVSTWGPGAVGETYRRTPEDGHRPHENAQPGVFTVLGHQATPWQEDVTGSQPASVPGHLRGRAVGSGMVSMGAQCAAARWLHRMDFSPRSM